MIRYPHRLPPGLKFLGNDRVRKHAFTYKKSVDFVEAVVHHFIRNPDPKVVPVYNFKRLEKVGGAYEYFYDMMLMGMLSDGEKKAITLFDNWWGYHKILPLQSANPDVQKACKEYPKLAQFMGDVLQEGRYFDTHNGNIMIDLEEDYRLVDIEGFMLHDDLSHPKNAWITKADPT